MATLFGVPIRNAKGPPVWTPKGPGLSRYSGHTLWKGGRVAREDESQRLDHACPILIFVNGSGPESTQWLWTVGQLSQSAANILEQKENIQAVTPAFAVAFLA